MKRVLAGLLSLVLCLGSVPVYGAEENIEIQNTEEYTESTESTDSEESPAVEENTESDESEIEIGEIRDEELRDEESEELPEISDREQESDFSTENQEDAEVEIQDDVGSEAEDYLENLTVYTSKEGTLPENIRTPERREDMDQEFGGKVYTVEYSSYASASSFYVSADLTDLAPEGSTLKMSAWSMDGRLLSAEMEPKSFSEGKRYRLNGRTFGNGENGGIRTVYTIKAGTEDESQIYKLVVLRRLDLSGIGCYLPEDEDLARNLISQKFDSAVREYSAEVTENAAYVQISAQAYSDAYYGLTVNGESVQSTAPVQVPLQTEEDTEIVLTMSAEGSYNDPDYQNLTYTSEGTYRITVSRQQNSAVEFKVTPQNAVVSVYDSKGERAAASAENTFLYENLAAGNTYTWNVSCYGYKSCQGSFVAGEEHEITANLEEADARQPEIEDNDWINYRNSDTNNGITSAATPSDAEETIQKWTVKIGGDWNSAVTPPLVLGGCLYAASGKFIYKLDRNTGEILAVSEELVGSMVFALNPLTYAEGMLFAQVGGGQIQALSATTLKSLWVSEPVGGQTLCPITYKDGYIYTGTWNSETTAGTYFALSVTDEDPTRGDEIKHCTWKYSHKGGFYWAGAYASEDYLVFGSDDGAAMGTDTNTSILYSVSTKTGNMLDKLSGINGDIRTTVSYSNGCVYFATKGGYLYRVRMNADGTFGQVVSYDLGGMATATPLIYKGRIYIGVCGQGGQFNADGGHHFDVLQESEDGLSLAYSVPVSGYPQAAPLLSNAYENQDFNGDGIADGRVYIYFTANAFPGGIYMLKDEPGQTQGNAEEIFVPDTEQQQYSISTLCVDRDGTIYYKNDSNYMMAIEKNDACLTAVKVTAEQGEVIWDRSYQKDKTSYNLSCGEKAGKITFRFQVAEGGTLTVNGNACDGTFVTEFAGEEIPVTAVISKNGKSRRYVFTLTGDRSSAALKNLTVSSSNTYADTDKQIPLNPSFAADRYEYTTECYEGEGSQLNIFVEPEDESATVHAEGISGTRKVNDFGLTAGSGKAHRIAVYFAEEEAQAQVRIQVQTKTGKTASYTVVLRRTDVYPPILTDGQAARYENVKVRITFTSNEAGRYAYQMVTAEQKPEFSQEFPNQMIQGSNTIDLTVPEEEDRQVYILACDQDGNRMSQPLCISVPAYRTFIVNIRTIPEDAMVEITDQDGQILSPEKNGYTWVEGNTYRIQVSKTGYETVIETVKADSNKTEYSYTLKSMMSSNAELKHLYVSSSDTYGKGIQKIDPTFETQKTNYTVTYGGERQSLNVWTQAQDAKAAVRVYALAGISGSVVQKDETIHESKTEDGHVFWKIVFAQGEKEAKIRIQVTAEDGTAKNTYLTLRLTDTTAPVLKKVSASRIAEDKASVVYKSSEKGYRYFKVIDAGTKVPAINTSGKGTEIQAGTDTVSLTGLTAGEKDLVIVVKDAAGNVSEPLVIRIPDVRKANGNSGSTNGGVLQRPGSGGHKSQAGIPGGGSNGEGSKANLKMVSGSGSGGSGAKKDSASEKKKNSKGKGTKKGTGDSSGETGEQKKGKSGKKTDGKNGADEENSSEETTAEEQVKGEKTSVDSVMTGLKEMNRGIWLLLVLAVLGIAYILFWMRARYCYRRRMLK